MLAMQAIPIQKPHLSTLALRQKYVAIVPAWELSSGPNCRNQSSEFRIQTVGLLGAMGLMIATQGPRVDASEA